MSFNAAQTTYRDSQLPGFVGDLARAAADIVAAINANPQAKQLVTVTVDTAADSTAYALTINGEAISITSGSSGATKTAIRDQLIDAINSNVVVSGLVQAYAKDADEFYIESLVAGVAFTFAESDGNLSSANTTANATAAEVPYGALVVDGGVDANGQRLGKLAAATALTARAIVLTPTEEHSADYVVTITMRDSGKVYEAVYTSDENATVKEIVEGLAAAINAAMPANTVVATEDDATLTLTSEIAGLDFEATGQCRGSTGTCPITSDNGSRATDINEAILGIAIGNRHMYEPSSSGTQRYGANTPMSICRKGHVFVEVEDADLSAVGNGDPVYIRLADPATTGNAIPGYRLSAAAGCVRLRGARVENVFAAAGLVELRANFD